MADLFMNGLLYTGGSKGGGPEGGQGGHGPPPKGLTKMIKMAQFAAFYIIKKKISQGTPLICEFATYFWRSLPLAPANANVWSCLWVTLRMLDNCVFSEY